MTPAGDGSGRTRVLGIDVGSVRIGLAVSDETCTLASPAATIPNESRTLWVRLERIVHDEFGIERLFLVSRGRRLSIAACLSPDEKADFAKALSSALGEAKRGPTRTVLE